MGSAIVIIIVGLAYLLLSFQYSIGTMRRPGPGALPMLLGAGLAIVGVALCAASLRERTKAEKGSSYGETLRPAFIVTAGLIGYVLLWPVLGTVFDTAALCLVLCKTMGGKGWAIPVTLSVACALGVFWAFGVLLGVPFPEGVGVLERLLR